MKRMLILLLSVLLLSACAAGGQAPAPEPSALPESPSSLSESAPEPVSEPAPEPVSSQPEEPPSAPNRVEMNPDTSVEDWVAPPPKEEDRDRMANYLETTLTDEKYTSFYWREEGLGVLTPDVERVKEVVAAYDGPAIDMEYCEAAISKARHDAAREAFLKLQKSLQNTSNPIIANSGTFGLPDDPDPGKIHIEIHQMHPALQEFLDTGGYGDCFVVNITGADSPIVNPDT